MLKQWYEVIYPGWLKSPGMFSPKEEGLILLCLSVIVPGLTTIAGLLHMRYGWSLHLLMGIVLITILLLIELAFSSRRAMYAIRLDQINKKEVKAIARIHREAEKIRARWITPDVRYNQVYFILDTTSKAIKIGVSLDPAKRMEELQVATPHKLTLLLVTPGGYALEKQLHQHFAHCRIRGEWFQYSKEIQTYIASINMKGDYYHGTL